MLLDESSVGGGGGASPGADGLSIDSEETDSVGGDDGDSTQSGSLQSRPSTGLFLNGASASVGAEDGMHSHQPTTSGSTIITVGEDGLVNGNGHADPAAVPPDDGTPVHFHQNLGPSQNDEIATLRRSRFNTIRTAKAVKAELEAYRREGSANMAEAMVGYKRLRQQHQKELRSAEERCRGEMAALKAKLDSEYELLLKTFHKELHKLHASHNSTLERKAKQNEEMERKLRKQLVSAQEKELKAFVQRQKREYKASKERLKAETKAAAVRAGRSASSAWEAEKGRRASAAAEAEAALSRQQGEALELELRRLQRRRLLQYEALEAELLREELAVRGRQLETTHGVLRRHHASTAERERRHLEELQALKTAHLAKQHSMEAANQHDYTRKKSEELAKLHAIQSKQHPRELKAKEIQIRKQFHATVKTQTRQYKLLQTQLLQQAPREEHKELISRLKEEQKRKLAKLTADYDSTVATLIDDQNLKLESWQEEEAANLKDRLQQELELLSAFQSKQRKQMESTHEGERAQLGEKVSLRCAVLEQKMEEEAGQLDRERHERTQELDARQKRELDVFDEESTRRGLSLAALSPSGSPSLAGSMTASSRHSLPNSSGASTPVH